MLQRSESCENGPAGNIHFLRRRPPVPDSVAVHFSLSIENFQHIRRAYGEDNARAVLSRVHLLITDFLRFDGIAVPEMSGAIDVMVWNVAALGGGDLKVACKGWLDALCQLVPLVPIATPSGPVHLWLRGAWQISDQICDPHILGTDKHGSLAIEFRGDPPGGGEEWAERYRADMAAASTLLSAIAPLDPGQDADIAPLLLWQPIRNAGGGPAILYHEALLRLLDEKGLCASLSDVFPILERLGFARVVDHYVTSRVLDELESAPKAVLGVNISARSVIADEWWEEIRGRLLRSPGVAERLVLEITETAAMPDLSQAVRFTSSLRRLGCKIALDDFGTGFASIRQVLAFAPDVVKIDRFFLRRCTISEKGPETIRHLIGLAASLNATVVVEGVETSEQSMLALDAGGVWQQGYYWGRPALGISAFYSGSSHNREASINA